MSNYGYGAAKKLANKVFDGAKSGSDFLRNILIVGGVAAVAVIGILAFLALRKR